MEEADYEGDRIVIFPEDGKPVRLHLLVDKLQISACDDTGAPLPIRDSHDDELSIILGNENSQA